MKHNPYQRTTTIRADRARLARHHDPPRAKEREPP